MLETVFAVIMAFAGTNIDDILIDTIFFAQADTRQKVHAVVAGKYLGIGALVLLSFIGARCLNILPERYIGLMGIVPIALGVKEWIEGRKQISEVESDARESSTLAHGLLTTIALLTLSNGADNLGVYIPLFSGYGPVQMVLVVIIYSLMTALLCLAGKKLSDLPGLRRFLIRYKNIIVPAVYILLGVYILIKAL